MSAAQQDQAEQPSELSMDNEDEELIKNKLPKKSRRSSIPELVGVGFGIHLFVSLSV